MVKTKTNTTPKKKKTKLKQRKEEKKLRKMHENKFTYKYKKLINALVVIALITLVSVSGYMMYQAGQEGKNTVELGDEVKLNFISYYDSGEIIQHTIASSTEEITVDTPLDGYQLKNPQRLPVGGYKEVSGMLIPLFWNDQMLVGMEKGNEYTISIPAEWSYGGQMLSPITEEERIFSVSRETEASITDTIAYAMFVDTYGEPAEGAEYEGEDLPFTVTEFNESVVTVRYGYTVGDTLDLQYGTADITGIEGDTATALYQVDMETVFVSDHYDSYLPVHIAGATDTELEMEVEHYNYKIRVEDVENGVIEAEEWAIDGGDLAIVRYIGYYEDGEVFDSSVTTEDADVTSQTPLDNTFTHKELYTTVQPGTLISGTQSLIDGFNDALVGMVAGDEKTIEVAPEDGYGEYDDTLVVDIEYLVGEYALSETISRQFTFTLEDYMAQFSKEPLVDDLVELDYGLAQVASVDDTGIVVELTTLNEGEFTLDNLTTEIVGETEDDFVLERHVEDGDIINVSGGSMAYAAVENGMVTVAYDPDDFEVGSAFGYGKVIEKADTYLKVDNNNEMAGKTLFFKIRVMGFKKV